MRRVRVSWTLFEGRLRECGGKRAQAVQHARQLLEGHFGRLRIGGTTRWRVRLGEGDERRHAFGAESGTVILARLRRHRGRHGYVSSAAPSSLHSSQADHAVSASRFAGNQMRAAFALIARTR